MRKVYKDDADIINKLTNTPEVVIDFDKTLNGEYEFLRYEEMDYKQDRELELGKSLPAKTSLMIWRTEIPKWKDQKFDVWKKEL